MGSLESDGISVLGLEIGTTEVSSLFEKKN